MRNKKYLLLFLASCLSLQLFAQKKDDKEIARLTTAFEAKKTKLTCPLVASRVDYKTLYLDENRRPTRGVDLISDSLSVYCPSEGYVTAIFPGDNNTQSMIISHGNYFSVYSGFKSISVKQGTDLMEGQLMGKASLDDKKMPRLHFEIWFNTDKLWPPDWLGCAQKR